MKRNNDNDKIYVVWRYVDNEGIGIRLTSMTYKDIDQILTDNFGKYSRLDLIQFGYYIGDLFGVFYRDCEDIAIHCLTSEEQEAREAKQEFFSIYSEDPKNEEEEVPVHLDEDDIFDIDSIDYDEMEMEEEMEETPVPAMVN